jgi:two-component system, chemotaxis family, protein-glutamate methylesterase/glutaminase
VGQAADAAGVREAPAFPVVALVGSSGGITAVTKVLSGLPSDLAAAVVVLIHTVPDRTSLLVDVFRRVSRLPVVDAEQDTPLRAGCVIVVPPGKHLLIRPDGRTTLIVSGEFPPNRPSADLLLATLATALGPRALAVILSGTGHDGATGASAIHACGGTVLATDELSSAMYSMPLAAITRDGAVDRVLPLDQIADALVELMGTEASDHATA